MLKDLPFDVQVHIFILICLFLGIILSYNLQKRQERAREAKIRVITQARELNLKGIDCDRRRDFHTAVLHFTKAIELCPHARKYVNRATSYVKLKLFEQAVKDCEQALVLDPSSVKANVTLGAAKSGQSKWTEAIVAYKEALSLSKRNNLVQETSDKYIRKQLLHVIKEQQKLVTEQEIHSLKFLKTYFTELVDLKGDDEEKQYIITQLDNLFAKKTTHIASSDPPPYFCCPLSMEIMVDPVCSPSGISYERSWIEKHIQVIGPVDPITRQPIDKDKLKSNINLRQAIEAYYKSNPFRFNSM